MNDTVARELDDQMFEDLSDFIRTEVNGTQILSCIDRDRRWNAFFLLREAVQHKIESYWKVAQSMPLPDHDSTYSGKILLHRSAKIHSYSTIDGNIALGPKARIGPSAYVHGRCFLGEGTVAGFGMEVKSSIFSSYVKAYHYGFIGDSLLWDEVNVGAGTVTAVRSLKAREAKKRGAIVGSGCRLGVQAALMPGAYLTSGTTVLPGEIKY